MDAALIIYLIAFIVIDVTLRLSLTKRGLLTHDSSDNEWLNVANRICPTSLSFAITIGIAHLIAWGTPQNMPEFMKWIAVWFALIGLMALLYIHRQQTVSKVNLDSAGD